jgi:hypothetical protein
MYKTKYRSNESYLHLHAKRVLADWLSSEYIRIVDEERFMMNGRLWFVTDLACYNENGLKDIYEIVHTHDVDVWKQWRMYYFFMIHKWDVNVFRMNADWIMKQVRKPETIKFQEILRLTDKTLFE